VPEGSDEPRPQTQQTDSLTERVADVLDAGLQIGASLARTLAGVTGTRDTEATGKPPIDDIVTFGSAAATNLVGLVASGARAGASVTARTASGGRGAATSSGAQVSGPMLRAGSTLRVPLLVENTGHTPTRALTFEAASVHRVGCEDGEQCTCLPSDGVTFTPESLVVAARDFEKLTVRVATPEDAPVGDYVASIVAGDGWFSTSIGFTVIAREA
jgi:hypothetical protein